MIQALTGAAATADPRRCDYFKPDFFNGIELLLTFGDGRRVQAAAVWDFEDVGFAATSIPSVNLTP